MAAVPEIGLAAFAYPPRLHMRLHPDMKEKVERLGGVTFVRNVLAICILWCIEEALLILTERIDDADGVWLIPRSGSAPIAREMLRLMRDPRWFAEQFIEFIDAYEGSESDLAEAVRAAGVLAHDRRHA